MATFLNFDVGGRPYNSQDFASLQNQLIDMTRIYAVYNNGNNYIIEGCAQRGQAGTVWMDGKVRAVLADPTINNSTPFPVWIIAQNSQVSRVYADGQAKVAFNVFNGAWSTTPPGVGVSFLVFNNQTDLDKNRLITFITPDAVPTTGGTYTGDITVIDSVRTVSAFAPNVMGSTLYASTGAAGDFQTGVGFNTLFNGSNYVNFGDGSVNVSGGVVMRYTNPATPTINFFLKPSDAGTDRFQSNLDISGSVKMTINSQGDVTATRNITGVGGFFNSLQVNKVANVSRIDFPASTNDPGFITHSEISNNAVMTFSVSDDFDANDYFSFGATPSGTYNEGIRFYANGQSIFRNNMQIQGSASATDFIASGTSLLNAVNTAQSTANTAQSTANTANANASNAQATANAANATASSLAGTVNTHTSQISDLYTKILPSGAIIMWAGTSPPAGWVLCDGSAGSPDLRGRFIVGYNPFDGDYFFIGQTGGEKAHTLSVSELPSHSHSITGSTITNFGGSGSVPGVNFTGAEPGGNTNSTGSNFAHENRPPYYTLAYIFKL